jgi:hypothetical protein
MAELTHDWRSGQLDDGKSAASFCRQVAAWFSDMFYNFYSAKNNKIAKNSTTAKAREKVSTYLESLYYVWLYLKTIKIYLIELATDVYWQPSYLLGEKA